jgi:hypothetical protein
MARRWIGSQITVADKTVPYYEHSGESGWAGFLVQCHIENNMIMENRESVIVHNAATDRWEGWVDGSLRADGIGAYGREKVFHQMSHMLRGYRGDEVLPDDICPGCTWDMVG